MISVLCNKNLLFINKDLLNNNDILNGSFITIMSTGDNVALSDKSVTSLVCVLKNKNKNKIKKFWVHSYACEYTYDENLYNTKTLQFPSGNISFESIKNNNANLHLVLNIYIANNTTYITFLNKR